MTKQKNVHATLISIDGNGVLIMGPSGSGKTLLARHLFRRCRAAKIPAMFISDDQVLLEVIADALIGTAPHEIIGKIEVFGFGICDVNQCVEDSAPIQLQVELGARQQTIRFWDGKYFAVGGISIQSLVLSTDQLEAAGNAVLSALGYDIDV